MLDRNRYGLFTQPTNPSPPRPPGPDMGFAPPPLRNIPETISPLATPQRGRSPGVSLPTQGDPYAMARMWADDQRRKSKWSSVMQAGLTMLAHGGRDGTLGESIAAGALTGLGQYAGSKAELREAEQQMAQQLDMQMKAQMLQDPRMIEALGLTPDQATIFKAMPVAQQFAYANEQLSDDEGFNTVPEGAVAVNDKGELVYDNSSPEEPEIVRVDTGTHVVAMDEKTGDVYWTIPKGKLPDTENPQELATSLRKEWMSQEIVSDWGETMTQAEGAIAALMDPSRVADLDLIYTIAKLVDPGSVVREGEVKIVEGMTPEVQMFIGQLNSILRGETRFTTPVRMDILNMVERRTRARWNQYVTARKAYTGIVEDYNVPERWVFLDDRLPWFTTSYEPVEVTSRTGGSTGRAPNDAPPASIAAPGLNGVVGGGTSSVYEQFPWMRPGGGS